MFGISRKMSPCDLPETTVRKIASLNQCCNVLSRASVELSRVHQETQQLLASIGELRHVSQALPDRTKESIQAIGCSQAIDRCAESCASLEQDIRVWTRSGGGEAISPRLRAVRQQIRLAACSAEITSARDILSLAIRVIELHALQQTGPAAYDEKNPIALSMQHWVQEVSEKSRAAYFEAEALARELETQYARALTRRASGNPNVWASVAGSLEQAEKQKQAYVRVLRSCEAAMEAIG
ncbi:hypothetical protein Tdes44962_MAKER02348 [Teratosphaeria destructans]|uniref:Fungal N-terminal domain-containing protein n=1 Tax=Teratosphaeria destructans TaxID=418781 RepID=A0A9W7STR6_9PEZI|nr:hypothetical protein Tdes44962_MAKER02348 [Teratosphaeria destructans]